jgi:hypothetical protein
LNTAATRLFLLASAASLVLFASSARAFDGYIDIGQSAAFNNIATLNYLLTDSVLDEDDKRASRERKSDRRNKLTTASTVIPGVQGASIARIASHYPEKARPNVERVFREMLTGYAKIERQFGIPKHDVAGSVAAFLAGSYMAYRNVDFPDEHFKPLVAQMRQIIGSNPDFAKASNAEKQEMHEQMAILGMFMATTQMALKEKPNAQIAANMRQAAQGYLEQFLKTDADRVQITAQGLVLK